MGVSGEGSPATERKRFPGENIRHPRRGLPDLNMEENEHISLCEALDRILHKGAVVAGELTISVANVDLLYLGLQVILSSIETARGILPSRSGPLSSGAKNEDIGTPGVAHQGS